MKVHHSLLLQYPVKRGDVNGDTAGIALPAVQPWMTTSNERAAERSAPRASS